MAELSPGSPATPRGDGPAAGTPAPEGEEPEGGVVVRLPSRVGSAARARRARRLRVLVRPSRPLRRLRVTLRQGKRVVASGRRASLRSRGRITLTVRRGLRSGRASLRLTARDGAGRPVRVVRRVRLSR
jgi:hypothetical protein